MLASLLVVVRQHNWSRRRTILAALAVFSFARRFTPREWKLWIAVLCRCGYGGRYYVAAGGSRSDRGNPVRYLNATSSPGCFRCRAALAKHPCTTVAIQLLLYRASDR